MTSELAVRENLSSHHSVLSLKEKKDRVCL